MFALDGALFDLDGTLLDSMWVWEDIPGRYLRARGLTPGPGLNERFSVFSPPEAAAWLRAHYPITDNEAQIVHDLNEIVRIPYFEQVQPKPGTLDFLQHLIAGGVRLCVATATDRPLVEAALTRLNMLSFFEAIYTCSEAGAGKTRPDIFQKARAGLGTPLARTVVFEDSLYAIRTAKAAGFPVAAVYDRHDADKQAAIRELADWYSQDLRGFLEVFSGPRGHF